MYFPNVCLGMGQFGKVYTAVNNTNGELLAVKIQSTASKDRKFITKLVKELEILEGISHPNLVKYYGLELDGVSSYIVWHLLLV